MLNQLRTSHNNPVLPSNASFPPLLSALSTRLNMPRGVWIFVISIFLFYSSPAFAQLANSPWPMFMHDVQHTGQSSLNGPQKNTLYLQYQTGSEIVASPVLGTDGTIYVGDTSGKFHAINQDGITKWTYSTGGEISATAAIDTNDTIYVG